MLIKLRVWLKDGIEVERFHPSEKTTGTSNLLPDLVYHLMTDTTAGIGEHRSKGTARHRQLHHGLSVPAPQPAVFQRCNFTRAQNLRDYITEVAPFFLLDFAIINGKFSFTPAVPMSTSTGTISTGAVPISALFSEGNIIEGSFEVEYLEADQRRDFIAVMRWRFEQVNKLPEERVVVLRWDEANAENYPLESFDLTDYCCSEEHAVIAAKYLL